MAAVYDISITDLKVTIAFDGNIDTYARDKYKASLYGQGVKFINIKDDEPKEIFKLIDLVSTITDYRDGTTTIIPVPATLELLYTDVIEDRNAPFFFEQFQVNSAGAVDVDLTTESVLADLNTSALNSATNNDILEVLMSIDKTLKKIYKPE